MRHGSAKAIAAFVLKHPSEALEYPFMAYSTGPKAALISVLHHQDRFKTIALNRGHLESASVTAGGGFAMGNLRAPCVIPAKFLGKGSDSAQRLRAEYAKGNTRTLVFLAPVPACYNVSSVTAQNYDSVKALIPNVLPPSYYRDDNFYIHLDPSAVPAATASLATAVKQALAEPVR